MKKITRTLYLTKDDLNLIEKDINAKDKYTVFSNREEGTIEVDVTIDAAEEFRITEDVLFDLIVGLTPSLSEKEHDQKLTQVCSHLRALGLSL